MPEFRAATPPEGIDPSENGASNGTTSVLHRLDAPADGVPPVTVDEAGLDDVVRRFAEGSAPSSCS